MTVCAVPVNRLKGAHLSLFGAVRPTMLVDGDRNDWLIGKIVYWTGLI
jgi:hypothetical protein